MFILISVYALMSSCKHSAAPAEEQKEIITPVTITPVMIKAVSSTLDLPAVTTFMNKSIIRAATSGTIEKISVVLGDYISVDKPVFTLRTREAMAMKNAAENDSSLSFRGLININSAKAGVISSVSHQKGDFVQEGDELAVVSEESSLVFIMEVPVELEKFVPANRECTIELPDNLKLSGTITGKLPEMNIESQTVRYMIKASSPGRLPGNLIANVSLVRSSNDKAIVLPKKAVLSDETQSEFWVMKLLNDSVAVKIIISKGFENNEEVEIIKPHFQSTDRIVLTGNYGLPDTARIAITRE